MIALVIGFGLLIGSFCNALIWRLHTGESIAQGRSKCPHCHHVLGVWDLIPVLSWLWLRGKCRYCSQPISWQYPAVELVVALLFMTAWLILSPQSGAGWIQLCYWWFISASLVVLAVYDLRWMLLPDRVTLPAIAVSVLYLGYLATSGVGYRVWLGPALAALIAGGVFYGLAAFSGGKWMGGGDIKLAFLMGLILGLEKTLLAMILAFNVAAIVSLTLLATKRLKRSDHIPFGPFLVLGTLVALFWGGAIINWYLSLSAGLSV